MPDSFRCSQYITAVDTPLYRSNDIILLADPAKNLKLIMKDGKIYKNTIK